MQIAQSIPTTLIGRSFDCMFEAFVPRLTFRPNDELRVQANIGGNAVDQVVPVEVSSVRPNVFIVSWVEDNGNFIVQLQDHEKGIVHNHARLADGQVFRAAGALKPVQ
ncbi:MAG: hypothetical protein NTV73_02420 [Hyphomicrobiales bacterium]|nr:hypothetical protein [Hyphomicrobiales bacterium]